MSELTDAIREELKDRETRFIYDEDLLNTYVATQIKVLREQRGWTQQKLAEEANMKQERISVLEDVNYSSWTANVLKRLAKAFDLRLTIKFEEFNTYLKDFQGIKRESLEKLSFEDDPAFKDDPVEAPTRKQESAPVAVPALINIVDSTAKVIQFRSRELTSNEEPLKVQPHFSFMVDEAWSGKSTTQDIKPPALASKTASTDTFKRRA